MSELLKERLLVALALLLCTVTVLLAVWETPDILPKATVYTESSAASTRTAAVSGASGYAAATHPGSETASSPSSAVPAKPAGPAEPTPGGRQIKNKTATREELTVLPGIGDTLAGRIVDYRETHGGFASVEEIQNVSGIGEKRFAAIRDWITVG